MPYSLLAKGHRNSLSMSFVQHTRELVQIAELPLPAACTKRGLDLTARLLTNLGDNVHHAWQLVRRTKSANQCTLNIVERPLTAVLVLTLLAVNVDHARTLVRAAEKPTRGTFHVENRACPAPSKRTSLSADIDHASVLVTSAEAAYGCALVIEAG